MALFFVRQNMNLFFPAILLALPLPLAVLAPLLPVRGYYDVTRWLEITFLIAYLLFALQRGKSIYLDFPLLFLLISVFFSVITMVSVAPDLNMGQVLFWLWDTLFWLVPVLCGLALGAQFREIDLCRLLALLAYVVASVAVLYGIVILMGLLFWYDYGAGGFDDFVPLGFYNIRFWSHLATWLFPMVCLASVLAEISGRKKLGWLFSIAGGVWLLAALGSGARGHLLATFSIFVFIVLVFKDFRVGLSKATFRIVVIGVLLFCVFVILIPDFLFEGTSRYRSVVRSGLSGRSDLWALAVNLSFENFPFGVGALQYSYDPKSLPFSTPHGFYFRWAAEYGWLSLLAFILACFGFCLKFFRSKSEVDGPSHHSLMRVTLLWSILAAFSHALVSGVFTNSSSMLVALPMLTLFVAVCSKKSAKPVFDSGRRLFTLSFTLLLLGGSIVALPETYRWWRSSVQDQATYIEEAGSPLAPRFWLHGRHQYFGLPEGGPLKVE